MKFNKDKIQYKVPEVKYLGLVFSKEGVKPDKNKVEAIVKMKKPQNKKDVQRFLGMLNFLHNFLPNLSIVAAPLRELIRNNICFVWSRKQQESFDKLKALLSNTPVLKYFESGKKIIIQTDASQDGLGCCLIQDNQPVAFASTSLTSAQKNYPIIEKELLGIVFACQKFHQFIYGNEVEIHTDHKPLIGILKKDLHKATTRIQRMHLKLLKYNLNVKYVPGKFMFIPDLLSRAFLDVNALPVSELNGVIHSLQLEEYLPMSEQKIKLLQEDTIKDITLFPLMNFIHSDWKGFNSKVASNEMKHYFKLKNDLFVKDNIVFFNNKIVVPSAFKKYVLTLVHAGHFGMIKCKNRARKIFYWHNMNFDIEEMVRKCKECEKYQRSSTFEPLLSHKIPDLPFYKIGIDIAEHARKSYLIWVDYLSKWFDIIPIENKSTKEIISKLVVTFASFGIPKTIVCDNNPFSSYLFKEFSHQWNFEIVNSSPYYARSNGLAEKAVGIAKSIIKKCKNENDIYYALLEYRCSPVAGLPYSPSEILMGRLLRTKLPISREVLKPKLVYEDAYAKLCANQEKVKTYHDLRVKVKAPFKVNDKVVIQNKNNKVWEPAKVVEINATPRSYKVMTENTNIVTRNSLHIKKSRNEPNFRQDSYDELPKADHENRVVVERQGLNKTDSNYITRSGRRIVKPSRFKDYV